MVSAFMILAGSGWGSWRICCQADADRLPNGLAVTILIGQLPKLFGFSTDADNLIDKGARSWTAYRRVTRSGRRWRSGS